MAQKTLTRKHNPWLEWGSHLWVLLKPSRELSSVWLFHFRFYFLFAVSQSRQFCSDLDLIGYIGQCRLQDGTETGELRESVTRVRKKLNLKKWNSAHCETHMWSERGGFEFHERGLVLFLHRLGFKITCKHPQICICIFPPRQRRCRASAEPNHLLTPRSWTEIAFCPEEECTHAFTPITEYSGVVGLLKQLLLDFSDKPGSTLKLKLTWHYLIWLNCPQQKEQSWTWKNRPKESSTS